MTTLTLYTRIDCHLCDEMKVALERLQQSHDFSLSVVDIDADQYLQMRFNEKVPVLSDGDQEICHYHLDEEVLLKHLRNTTL